MRGLDTFMKFIAITKYAAGICGSAAPQTAEGAPMEAPQSQSSAPPLTFTSIHLQRQNTFFSFSTKCFLSVPKL